MTSDARTHDLARVAYAAYGRSTGNRTYDGREMPVWEDLGEGVQRAWTAAAAAVAGTFAAAAGADTFTSTAGTTPATDHQLMDAFTEAVQQANETGSATVGFRNGSVDQAGNQSVETGYDITVVRVGAVRTDDTTPASS